MKNGLFALLLIVLCIAYSCEKESSPKTENEGLPLITKEIFSDDLFNEFSYNEQNLLTERKSKWFYTLYHYDSNNRVTSYDLYEDPGIYSSNWETAEAAMNRTEWVNAENTEISGKASYSYKNQIPESITILRIPGGAQNKSAFLYDDKGRIGQQVLYYEGEASGKIVYAYDARGNVIKEELFANDEVFVTRLFEYDDRHNPFKVFRHLLIPGINTNENNIIRATQILENNTDPGIETVHVTESSYEYNDQGYPILKNGYIRYEYK
jgi:hypothetical protein